MKKKKPAAAPAKVPVVDYGGLLGDVVLLLEAARRMSARAVNAVMTATYWEIGRRIVEIEQQGSAQADYGDELIKRLAADLTARFGRGFSWRNLYRMRGFHLAYPQILPTLSAKSSDGSAPQGMISRKAEEVILPTLSAKSQPDQNGSLETIEQLAPRFPLSWSHCHDLPEPTAIAWPFVVTVL